jgi:hypothetical protein
VLLVLTSAASTPVAPRMLYGLQQTAVATRGLDCFPQSRPGEDGHDCMREQLRQELLDKQLGWRTKEKADGAGADFVDSVSKLLWYLTDHRDASR